MTKDTTSSARRALRVLKALKGHVVIGISNKALVESLGESDASICRALKELEAEGLAVKLDDGRWAHSVVMLQIAKAYMDHMDDIQIRMTEINQRVAAGAMRQT
jgi:DNA-binding IclR family transcriptional regulator